MKELKHMKDCLISCVQNQISGHLNEVDAKELGEAVDMIKDLEEAIYYATITKAMEEKPLEQQQQQRQQQQQSGGQNYMSSYYPPYWEGAQHYNDGRNYMNYNNGRNYNSGNSNGGDTGGRNYASGGNSSGNNGRSYYDGEMSYNSNMMMGRDMREGMSPTHRRMYMEGKEMGKEKNEQMKELEKYVHELSNDILEMVADASPEERQMLHQKISVLATKIK